MSSAAQQEFQVDVFLTGLPTGESVAGFGYQIGFPESVVEVADHSHGLLIEEASGSSAFDLSDDVPDTTSPHSAAVADLGSAEYNPPYSQGVLGRYTFKVLPTASAGVYGLNLEQLEIARDVPPGDEVTIDQVWDAKFATQYGVIAVDRSCVDATVTPSPTGTPTPSPTPTSTPSPGGTALAAGWNHVCYRGADQEISNALLQIRANVLAVYRLLPDQSYERWFPNRPDISTIVTLQHHEPLIILMAGAASWLQADTETPPASVNLAPGWNSVCYSGQAKEPQAATASMTGKFSVLYLLASDLGWKRFVPNRPEISNLAQLQQFAAVLVLVTQAEGATWTFDP